MKRCPYCNRIYKDDEFNYCEDDGIYLLSEEAVISESKEEKQVINKIQETNTSNSSGHGVLIFFIVLFVAIVFCCLIGYLSN